MGKKLTLDASNAKKLLAAVQKRRDILATQVQSVALKYTTALFVYGPGGLGKTHQITTILEGLCPSGFVHHTAYSTPKGLMLSIAEYPCSIHLFEDCEKLYKTDVACSILRAACGAPRQKERIVSYETQDEKYRVAFSGGIIIVSNENLSRAKGPLAAVASRFRPVQWDMTIEERLAVILSMSEEGFDRGAWKLTPKECKTVAKFLIEQCLGETTGTPIDLRLYSEHALPAYAQWRTNPTGTHWRDIVRSKLLGSMETSAENRQQRNERLRTIAQMLALDTTLTTEQRKQKWFEATQLGMTIYYRHLKQAGV